MDLDVSTTFTTSCLRNSPLLSYLPEFSGNSVYYMNVNGVNHTFIRLQNNISMDGYQQHEKYIIEAFLKIPNVSYK